MKMETFATGEAFELAEGDSTIFSAVLTLRFTAAEVEAMTGGEVAVSAAD